jgi:hypothetical protein
MDLGNIPPSELLAAAILLFPAALFAAIIAYMKGKGYLVFAVLFVAVFVLTLSSIRG